LFLNPRSLWAQGWVDASSHYPTRWPEGEPEVRVVKGFDSPPEQSGAYSLYRFGTTVLGRVHTVHGSDTTVVPHRIPEFPTVLFTLPEALRPSASLAWQGHAWLFHADGTIQWVPYRDPVHPDRQLRRPVVCRFVLQIHPDGTVRYADRNPCAGQYVLYVLFVAWPTVPGDRVPAFGHDPPPGTLVVLHAQGHKEPWLLLTDTPPDRTDVDLYACRHWSEHGSRPLENTLNKEDRAHSQVQDLAATVVPAHAERYPDSV